MNFAEAQAKGINVEEAVFVRSEKTENSFAYIITVPGEPFPMRYSAATPAAVTTARHKSKGTAKFMSEKHGGLPIVTSW